MTAENQNLWSWMWIMKGKISKISSDSTILMYFMLQSTVIFWRRAGYIGCIIENIIFLRAVQSIIKSNESWGFSQHFRRRPRLGDSPKESLNCRTEVSSAVPSVSVGEPVLTQVIYLIYCIYCDMSLPSCFIRIGPTANIFCNNKKQVWMQNFARFQHPSCQDKATFCHRSWYRIFIDGVCFQSIKF